MYETIFINAVQAVMLHLVLVKLGVLCISKTSDELEKKLKLKSARKIPYKTTMEVSDDKCVLTSVMRHHMKKLFSIDSYRRI